MTDDRPSHRWRYEMMVQVEMRTGAYVDDYIRKGASNKIYKNRFCRSASVFAMLYSTIFLGIFTICTVFFPQDALCTSCTSGMNCSSLLRVMYACFKFSDKSIHSLVSLPHPPAEKNMCINIIYISRFNLLLAGRLALRLSIPKSSEA